MGPMPESMRSLGVSKTPDETIISLLARMVSSSPSGVITVTPVAAPSSMRICLAWVWPRMVIFGFPSRKRADVDRTPW